MDGKEEKDDDKDKTGEVDRGEEWIGKRGEEGWAGLGREDEKRGCKGSVSLRPVFKG